MYKRNQRPPTKNILGLALVRHYIPNYLAKKEAVRNSVCLGLGREIGDSNVRLYKTGP